MRVTQPWLVIGAIVVIMSGALPVNSLAEPLLEERVNHLEQLLENKVTIETINEVEALKTEVQQLRGKLDEQQHSIELLNKRQEKLFLDLEQRINQLSKDPAAQTPLKQYNYPTQSAPKNSTSNNEAKLSGQPALRDLSNNKEASRTNANEQELYNSAYKLIDAKRHKEALVALQDFLWKFPEGQYAANAHYWLGELYLSEWHSDQKNKINLDKAISNFKTVTAKYDKHHKAVDSLLKLGIIEAEQENWPAAKEYFTELKKKYPNSSRANIAEAKLKQLK